MHVLDADGAAVGLSQGCTISRSVICSALLKYVFVAENVMSMSDSVRS